jgi:hypothetical protein
LDRACTLTRRLRYGQSKLKRTLFMRKCASTHAKSDRQSNS